MIKLHYILHKVNQGGVKSELKFTFSHKNTQIPCG